MSTASEPHRNGEPDSQPCVSVIVPVYRAEKYVEAATECLLHQTLREMEFVFVDDCGGDGSAGVIEQYAAQDPRIVLLRNDANHGAGYSRNRGIEAARGKYIAFFDIDDSCDPDFYEVLYNLAETRGALICKGACTDVYEDGTSVPDTLDREIQEALAQGYALYSCFVRGHCTALYRRSWVMETGARNGVCSQGEDTFFQLQVCQGADTGFACTDKVRYYYQRRATSSSGIHDERFLRHQIAHRQEKLDYANSRNLSGKSYWRYCACILDVYADGYLLLALECPGGVDMYDEFADGLGEFISGIRGAQELFPYLHSAGSIALLRALTKGDPSLPWGRRLIVSLLQNADPDVKAMQLPRTNSLADRFKRTLVNAFFSFIGLDHHARGRLWSRMQKH